MDRCRIRGAGMGMMGMGKMGMGMMGMGKMGMGMMGMGGAPDVADEAEAVGDPHMTLAISGEKEDLCCEGGECKPCPPALLQEDDESLDQVRLEDDQNPANMCRSGIRVRNVCYDKRCGSTGRRPGGRGCGGLPGGANACCMTRIQRTCTGPNMDRCRIRGAGMGMMG